MSQSVGSKTSNGTYFFALEMMKRKIQLLRLLDLDAQDEFSQSILSGTVIVLPALISISSSGSFTNIFVLTG